MKRPEYVAGAVNACRVALDGGTPDLISLKTYFREADLQADILKMIQNMQGVRTKDDVTSATSKVLSAMKQYYHKPFRRFPADITVNVKADSLFAISCRLAA